MRPRITTWVQQRDRMHLSVCLYESMSVRTINNRLLKLSPNLVHMTYYCDFGSKMAEYLSVVCTFYVFTFFYLWQLSCLCRLWRNNKWTKELINGNSKEKVTAVTAIVAAVKSVNRTPCGLKLRGVCRAFDILIWIWRETYCDVGPLPKVWSVLSYLFRCSYIP